MIYSKLFLRLMSFLSTAACDSLLLKDLAFSISLPKWLLKYRRFLLIFRSVSILPTPSRTPNGILWFNGSTQADVVQHFLSYASVRSVRLEMVQHMGAFAWVYDTLLVCFAFLRYNIFFVIYDIYGYSEISGAPLNTVTRDKWSWIGFPSSKKHTHCYGDFDNPPMTLLMEENPTPVVFGSHIPAL